MGSISMPSTGRNHNSPPRMNSTPATRRTQRLAGSRSQRMARAMGSGASSSSLSSARFRFTAALANGHDLFAFRYAANDTPNSLYYRAAGNDVVVVSEPLDHDREAWAVVPDNTVLVARSGRPVELVPFLA